MFENCQLERIVIEIYFQPHIIKFRIGCEGILFAAKVKQFIRNGQYIYLAVALMKFVLCLNVSAIWVKMCRDMRIRVIDIRFNHKTLYSDYLVHCQFCC